MANVRLRGNMTSTSTRIAEHFESATDVLDLARLLGIGCLDEYAAAQELSKTRAIKRICSKLEQLIAAIDRDAWLSPGPDGTLAYILEVPGVRAAIERAEACPPAAYRAVLRGLCASGIPRRYYVTEGKVTLDRGSIVPLVGPRIDEIIEEPTPYHTTTNAGHLLQGLAHQLYRFAAGDVATVQLDFTYRHELDELTWTRAGRLPRIATLHPVLGGETMKIGKSNKHWFFDVTPTNWTAEWTLDCLRRVSDVEIAVLPELCLPAADALESALAAEPELYPPLVVAGSAHLTEETGGVIKEIRANESRIYLRGRLIARHRKIHPFLTKYLGGHELKRKLPEGITPERKTITVLSGEHTRLASVICADLNDDVISSLLHGAHVNLLLVPALTGGVGGFTGAVDELASKCQAISVVVNGSLGPKPEDGNGTRLPFLVIGAVPRTEPDEQSQSFHMPTQAPRLGVIDPNRPLGPDWIDWSRGENDPPSNGEPQPLPLTS